MATEKSNPVPVKKADPFESAKGEAFGGTYAKLELQPEECSPLLEFVKIQEIPVKEDDGDGTKLLRSPIAKNTEDPDGKLYSLPIGSIFRKHWDQAKVNIGDRFYVKRFVDAKKKAGRGAGTMMQNYGIKVTHRAPAA